MLALFNVDILHEFVYNISIINVLEDFIMPRIQSSTDLRNNYNEISEYCRKSGKPVFITKNGQGDLAVMSMEQYEVFCEKNEEIERLDPKEELYALLEEGFQAVENGEVYPLEEVIADLRRMIKNAEAA